MCNSEAAGIYHLFIQEKTNAVSSPVVLHACQGDIGWFLETFLMGVGVGEQGLLVSDLEKWGTPLTTKIIQPPMSTMPPHTIGQGWSEVHTVILLILRFPGAGGWRRHLSAQWLLCRARKWAQVLVVPTTWEYESHNDVKTIFTFSPDWELSFNGWKVWTAVFQVIW